MAIYKAPLRDMRFAIKELFSTDEIRKIPGWEDLSDDLLDDILLAASKYCEDVLFPLNRSGDEEGCTWKDGNVKTPKGFKEAYGLFVESGWNSLSCDPAYGGQGLPSLLSLCVDEMVSSANLSFSIYPLLAHGTYVLLSTHGSDSLKKKYLSKLVDGSWGGTMCLTESHCGTDLGMLRTKAVPQENGSFKLSGTKIFISSGEHDLTENILHFVLARTPDAPAGIHGISLFLVPKIMVKEDGTLGERNKVFCASIEHKMGIKASSTCVMNYDEATGYLIGDLHKGINHMFTLMNLARLGVGNQGLGISEIAYQNALQYAKERLQGRALTGSKHFDQPADPILVHPDIRRMLLTTKACNEGNRMLRAWVTLNVDIAARSPDSEEKKNADDFVQLMTPIVKSFFSDFASEAANLALQIYGGHGYIVDNGIEQLVRDARVTQIYEGTNGIQALDLIGRKLSIGTGRYLRTFFHPIQKYITENKDDDKLKEFIDPLSKAFGRLQQATLTIAQKGLANPDEAAAVATDYLRLFALVSLAYLWTRAAQISQKNLEGTEKDFYLGKIGTARFYMEKILPQSSSLFSSIMAGSKSLMNFEDTFFGPF